MIIATAGHVDHGKTSLVRQLTGVETDRLAEEQRRGLSINLGYAYLPRPQGTPLGFIDVPGHQRFINTMISGISGIDMGMLVVAADDGPMPQTHEHLDILQLLGIEQLTVVISKTDRVSPQRLQEVETQLREILASRPWPRVTVFPVSNVKGDGVAALQSHLLNCAEQTSARKSSGYFRLSIDRAFTARGAGLVVTGTTSSGSVCVGESLVLLPGGTKLRVRNIRAHDQAAERACAGQRVALNISGKVEAAAIERGDWLVAPEIARTSHRLDVSFSLLPSAPFAIKHLSPVKLYIGAKRIAGRLALLTRPEEQREQGRSTGNRLQPGKHCLAQLILEGDVACVRGERFLLRDHAEDVILGGGVILDPDGPRAGKSRPGRIAWLNAMKNPSTEAALNSLIAQDKLVDMDHFQQICNLHEEEALALLPPDGRIITTKESRWAVSNQRWSEAEQLLRGYIDHWHQENPLMPGIKMTDLQPALAQRCEPPLAMAVLVAQLKTGDLVLHEGQIRQAKFQAAVSLKAQAQWKKVRQYLGERKQNIPLLSEISEHTRIAAPDLKEVVKRAEKNGELCRITDTRYALPGQLRWFANELLSSDSSGTPLTVVGLKPQFGTGRRLTIEILEYFDSVHITRRQDDTRVILDTDLPVRLFSG